MSKNLVADHEFLLTGKYTYIPTGSYSLRDSRQVDAIKIFKRIKPNFMTYQEEISDSSLRTHTKGKCQLVSFLLQPETYIPISNGFLAIYTKDERLDVVCKDNPQMNSKIISKGTYKIQGEYCKIMTSRIYLNIRNNHQNLTRTFVQNITYPLNLPDLTLVKERMVSLPNVLGPERFETLDLAWTMQIPC